MTSVDPFGTKPEKNMVVVLGSTSGSFSGIIYGYFWNVFLPWVKREYGSTYNITVHQNPTVDSMTADLIMSDAFVFYGHGGSGSVNLSDVGDAKKGSGKKRTKGLGSGDGTSFGQSDWDFAFLARSTIGKDRLDLTIIESCEVFKSAPVRDLVVNNSKKATGFRTWTCYPGTIWRPRPDEYLNGRLAKAGSRVKDGK